MTETFIRFGDLPETGYSLNDETGQPEAGVSVYRAWWVDEDHDSITIEVTTDYAYLGGQMNGLFERPVYDVSGDLLEQLGGDGEPLLSNCTATMVGSVAAVNYVVCCDA